MQLLFVIKAMPPPVPPSVKGRANDHRVADFFGKRQRVVNMLHYFGWDAGLTDGQHRIFKCLAVFGLFNGLRVRAQKLDALLSKKPSSASSIARFSPVCPPNVGKMESVFPTV